MKMQYLVALGVSLAFAACSDPIIPKPDHLLSRDRMIDMLIELHLSQSIAQTRRFTSDEAMKYTESDYYYSVLQKFKTNDSTFEQSLVYYSGRPKEFEKIYTRVLNRLNEMEQEQAKKNQQPVDIGN